MTRKKSETLRVIDAADLAKARGGCATCVGGVKKLDKDGYIIQGR